SNNTFMITAPIITLTSPNGGENIISGKEYSITWTFHNVEKVNIDYSIDGGKHLLLRRWHFLSR
ncbi:MAG: hypothetical protein PHX65_08655, partial [Sulfurimonas sp.]|nr:hypothetical protein [Sulfurimonas sp.]